jgi:hypothetical protein
MPRQSMELLETFYYAEKQKTVKKEANVPAEKIYAGEEIEWFIHSLKYFRLPVHAMR